MTTTSHHVPTAEAYEQVKSTIRKTVNQFCLRYAIRDREEVHAEACLHFLHAMKSWKPLTIELSAWIRLYVWSRLMSSYRMQTRRDKKLKQVQMNVERIVQRERFDVERESLKLSEEGKAVLKTILENDPPPKKTNTGRPPWKRRYAQISLCKRTNLSPYHLAKAMEEVKELIS